MLRGLSQAAVHVDHPVPGLLVNEFSRAVIDFTGNRESLVGEVGALTPKVVRWQVPEILRAKGTNQS
jgi:hypothetical protein